MYCIVNWSCLLFPRNFFFRKHTQATVDWQNLSRSGCNYAKQEFNTCCERGSQEEESKVPLAAWRPVSSKTLSMDNRLGESYRRPKWKHLEDSLVAARMSQVVVLSYSVNIKCQNSTCSDYLSFFLQAQAAKQPCNFSPSVFSQVGLC